MDTKKLNCVKKFKLNTILLQCSKQGTQLNDIITLIPFKDNPQSWFIDAWAFHIVVHLNSNAYLDDFGPIKQGCLRSKYH